MAANMPGWVEEIIDTNTKNFGDDIDTATSHSLHQIQQDDRYNDLVERLIHNAVRDLVYDARCKFNSRVKRENRYYLDNAAPKVVPGKDDAVTSAYASVYDYYLAGMTIGSMTREDLCRALDQELVQVNGHVQNVVICRLLMERVKEGKTVRESVSVKVVREIIQKAKTLSRDKTKAI